MAHCELIDRTKVRPCRAHLRRRNTIWIDPKAMAPGEP